MKQSTPAPAQPAAPPDRAKVRAPITRRYPETGKSSAVRHGLRQMPHTKHDS